MSHIRIELPGVTARDPETKISLDGEDITRALERIQLDASGRDVTVVTLHLTLPTAIINGQADVRLPYVVEQTLKRLGWTPPADTLGAPEEKR